MGFLSGLGSIASSIGGKLFDVGTDFLGKQLQDKYINDPNSAEAYRRQKDFYKHRYQWMMDDMSSAGLNPILAAGASGFSTSGTPSVQMSQLGTAAPTESLSSAYAHMKEAQLTEEKSKTEKVEQLKKMAEVKTEIQRKYEVRAKAGLASEQERSIWFQIRKLHAETIRHMKEGFKTDAEKELARKQIQQLMVQLQRLKNVNTIYSNPASMALSIIREIANSLGLNVGVVAPLKGK